LAPLASKGQRRAHLSGQSVATISIPQPNLEDPSIMSQSTIHVVARITAKPDAVPRLQAVLAALLEPTRQESGCHRYTLLQNRQDPTDFTFVEEWAGVAAIDAHLQTSHIQAAFARVEGLLAAEPDIRQYEVVG
jgi:quinol monooxygenase YgiN